MRDSSGCKFQYDRVADLFRRPHRFLFVRRHPGFDDGDAVRLQDPLGFEFVQKRPAGCARAANHIFGQRAIPHGFRSLRQCGSLIKPAQIVGIAPHIIESAHSGIRIRERRDIAAIENSLACRHLNAAHPARKDRFAVQPRQRPQLFGGPGGIRIRLGRQDHQNSVGIRIFGRDLDRPDIALRRSVTEDVDWIVVAPVPAAGADRAHPGISAKGLPVPLRCGSEHRSQARPALRHS